MLPVHRPRKTSPYPNPSSDGFLPDAKTHQALAAFRDRLAHRYGDRLRGLVLFGSRARGDHREDSDADVAVFLDQVADPIAEQMDLAEDAYLLYLDLGIMIQPWVFRGSPRQPDPTRAARLLEVVRSEGIAV